MASFVPDHLWQEFSQSASELPTDRKELLSNCAEQTASLIREQGTANLLFVCTHNSRRSQFSHFWADRIAQQFGLDRVQSYSCGTEATACNERTIASLQRSGAEVASDGEPSNPEYQCGFAGDGDSCLLFSKAFGHPSLPTSQIVAMLCCDDADQRCPTVPGAAFRVPLHYIDPKVSDDSPAEAETYDARSHQIAGEMYFMLSELNNLLATAD